MEVPLNYRLVAFMSHAKKFAVGVNAISVCKVAQIGLDQDFSLSFDVQFSTASTLRLRTTLVDELKRVILSGLIATACTLA